MKTDEEFDIKMIQDTTRMKTDKEFLYKDLTYKIIGILMKVHTALGPGFPERIYHNAVIEEFKQQKIKFVSEKEINITYYLDLVVDDKVILEIKASFEPVNLFKAQLISYLKASPYKIGILANFGTSKLQYFRFYRRK